MAKISPSMTPKCLACDEAKSTICGGLNKDLKGNNQAFFQKE